MPSHHGETRVVWAAMLFVTVSALVSEILLHSLQDSAGRYIGGAFLVAAGLLGIGLILRSAPPIFSVTPTAEQWLGGVRPDPIVRLRHYTAWFILMRWVAVIVVLALTVVVVRVAELLDAATYWPLLMTGAALAALNVLYAYVNRSGRWPRTLLRVQVVGDLLVLTVLLHFSGGVENPLTIVTVVHVSIGGILLSRTECYATAAFASLSFACMVILELLGVLSHYTLLAFPHEQVEEELAHAAHESLYVAVRVGLHAFALFFIAFFATTVAARSRSDEKELVALADRAIRQEHLLQQALETTGTAMRVVDDRLRTRFANGRWGRWFSRGDGERWRSLDADRSDLRKTLLDGRTRSTLLMNGSSQPSEALLELSTGEPHGRVYRMTTASLLAPEGSTPQVVQIAQDVTDLKEAEAHLVRAGQLAAVGELASHVAHEVNNPIAIISAKARLMLTDERSVLSPRAAEELQKILALSDRVAGIAKGLLTYARPSSAERSLQDVTQPIRGMLAAIADRAEGAGVTVSFEQEESLPPVLANAQELEQVLLNIALNAIDAMPDGGRLCVRAWPQQGPSRNPRRDGIAIAVEDTGRGIPPEVRSKIFRPFFTTKAKGSGTGLGLAICARLVHSHGGEIAVSSEVGSGTTVTVWLPTSGPDRAGRSMDGGETNSRC